jgi:hypothetical protein
VLLTHGGDPTPRQRLIAAQLWVGPVGAIDSESACRYFGFRGGLRRPDKVNVVVPFEHSARSRDFVKVRRTITEIETVSTARLRYVVEPMAVLVAARDARNVDRAMDILSRALQTGLVTTLELQAVRSMLGDKGCGALDVALAAVGVALRSTSERWLHDVVGSSLILPEPLWNQWLDLGDGGQPVCADALWLEAWMLHEVNGRDYHVWGLQYESTSARTVRVTAAGLVATQSTPLRLLRQPVVDCSNLERTYEFYVGRDKPAGVTLIDPPAWAAA